MAPTEVGWFFTEVGSRSEVVALLVSTNDSYRFADGKHGVYSVEELFTFSKLFDLFWSILYYFVVDNRNICSSDSSAAGWVFLQPSELPERQRAAHALEVCGLRVGTPAQTNPPFESALLAAPQWPLALGIAEGDPLPHVEHPSGGPAYDLPWSAGLGTDSAP